jgi:hypothetical protein
MPETAALGLLEHVLLVASASLMVEHPSIGRTGECYEGQLPGQVEVYANCSHGAQANIVCSSCSHMVVFFSDACSALHTSTSSHATT